MISNRGRNRNFNDASSSSDAIVLNATTSTIISVANDERLFFHVDNDNNAIGFWLKLQAASVDDDKKGIFVTGKTGARPFWEMPVDTPYTGEISAIADTGPVDVYTTEY